MELDTFLTKYFEDHIISNPTNYVTLNQIVYAISRFPDFHKHGLHTVENAILNSKYWTDNDILFLKQKYVSCMCRLCDNCDNYEYNVFDGVQLKQF